MNTSRRHVIQGPIDAHHLELRVAPEKRRPLRILLAFWEAAVRLGGVPPIILPAPSAIGLRLFTSVPTLAADFLQTIRGVLAGYVIGCASGLLVEIG